MTQEERDRLYPESQRVLDKLAEQRRAAKKDRTSKRVAFAEKLEEGIREGGYNPDGEIDEDTLSEAKYLGLDEDQIRKYSKNFNRAKEIYGEDASMASKASRLKLRQSYAKKLKSGDMDYNDNYNSQKLLGLSNKQVTKVEYPEEYDRIYGESPKGNLKGTSTLRTGSLKDPARKIGPEWRALLRTAKRAKKAGFKQAAEKLALEAYDMKNKTPNIRGQYYGLAKDEQKARLTAAQIASQQPAPRARDRIEPEEPEVTEANFVPYERRSNALTVINDPSHPMHTPSVVAALKKKWGIQ
jgi:hypothetical protein